MESSDSLDDASDNVVQNKVIINDLLCFIHNNISTLSGNTLCRMCLETYSSNDILQAYSLFKDISSNNGCNRDFVAPNLSNQMTSGERILRQILYSFEQHDLECLPKFVSHGLHLPKLSSFYDNSFILPLLQEMQDLKQSFVQKQQILYTEILALRRELAQHIPCREKGIFF